MGLWGWSFSFLVTGQACVSESHTLIGFFGEVFSAKWGKKRGMAWLSFWMYILGVMQGTREGGLGWWWVRAVQICWGT